MMRGVGGGNAVRIPAFRPLGLRWQAGWSVGCLSVCLAGWFVNGPPPLTLAGLSTMRGWPEKDMPA